VEPRLRGAAAVSDSSRYCSSEAGQQELAGMRSRHICLDKCLGNRSLCYMYTIMCFKQVHTLHHARPKPEPACSMHVHLPMRAHRTEALLKIPSLVCGACHGCHRQRMLLNSLVVAATAAATVPWIVMHFHPHLATTLLTGTR
jgi:hypothetical protein